MARQGAARHGTARQAGRGGARHGVARHGMAGGARQGKAWHGKARQANSWRILWEFIVGKRAQDFAPMLKW